jgi:hypothetical protein
MKTIVATAVSIAGVIAAGAAAFAVNTAVLQPSAVTEENQRAMVSLNSVVLDSPDSASSQSANNAAVPIAQSSTSQTSTYKVGDAGRVILEVVDGNLNVANVLPATGWSAKTPEYEDGEIEVEFRKDSISVKFKAALVGDKIEVFVESEDESTNDSYEREYYDDDDDDDDDDHDDDDDDEDDEDEDDD